MGTTISRSCNLSSRMGQWTNAKKRSKNITLFEQRKAKQSRASIWFLPFKFLTELYVVNSALLVHEQKSLFYLPPWTTPQIDRGTQYQLHEETDTLNQCGSRAWVVFLFAFSMKRNFSRWVGACMCDRFLFFFVNHAGLCTICSKAVFSVCFWFMKYTIILFHFMLQIMKVSFCLPAKQLIQTAYRLVTNEL